VVSDRKMESVSTFEVKKLKFPVLLLIGKNNNIIRKKTGINKAKLVIEKMYFLILL